MGVVVIDMGVLLINSVLLFDNIHKRYNLPLWTNAFVAKHECIYSARDEESFGDKPMAI